MHLICMQRGIRICTLGIGIKIGLAWAWALLLLSARSRLLSKPFKDVNAGIALIVQFTLIFYIIWRSTNNRY